MKTSSNKSMYWVIATLGVALIPQLIAMPAQLVPLVVLPMAWRLVAEIRCWKPVSMLIRVSLTVFTVFMLVATYGGLMGRRAAVGLLTVMLALKLLETFRVRDARVVASLSLFLCGTQFLFSQGLTMVPYTIITMLFALVALSYLHRREAFRTVGNAPAVGASMFSDLGYSVRLLLLAIPAALVIFLLFPRWSSPLWGVPEDALDARSGLSDSMSPGSIQGLFMDDTPAFRVDFHGTFPPHQALYWRGPVFWQFDGTSWTGSFYGRNINATDQPEAGVSPWHYTIQLEPNEQHWLFALDYPVTVPQGARLSMDYQLYSRRPVTRLKSYEMISNPDFTDTPELGTVMRQAALDLPSGFNPRTAEMMGEWRRETPDDAALVRRVLTLFNKEEFHYTLNPPLLSNDTVDEFLFDTRSGFCEHYASAFTVMMRMAGIPARVVTGYQGGWYNEFGNYLLVRQSDAHAWSEVWLPDTGWTRVDPTAAVAPGRIENGPLDALNGRRHLLDFAWMRSARNGFDLLQRRWNDWVIAFGAERQLSLFRPFGIDRMDAARLVTAMLVLFGVVSLVMLPFVLRSRQGPPKDPAMVLWLNLRHKLEKSGIRTSASQSPTELAAAARSQSPQDSREIDRIARLYLSVRYAPGSLGFPEFARAVKAFKPAQKHKGK